VRTVLKPAGRLPQSRITGILRKGYPDAGVSESGPIKFPAIAHDIPVRDVKTGGAAA